MVTFPPAVSNELNGTLLHWDWRPAPNVALHRRRMLPRKSPRPPPWLQGLAVTLLTVLAVGVVFQRGSWADWGRPQWLEGDPLEVLARVKIAGEQPAHA